jgi:tyrosinase
VASSSFVGCGAVGNIMNDTNFASFAGTPVTGGATEHFPSTGTPGGIEATPHNYIHGFVCGDMCNFMSPLDPVFWLHHNMVEKCWVEWNFVRNNPNTNDTAWTDKQFDGFFDQDGNPVLANTVTPGIGLLLPVLSYQFDSLPVVPSPCAGVGTPLPGPSGTSMAAGWERLNNVKTTSDQNALKAKAQAGATVRLEVIKQFVLGRAAGVEVDKPTTLPISVDIAALKAAASAGQRTFIRFNQMTLNHTGDFSVKVFINKPDATAETPDTDPHFVGGVAFFSHVHEGTEETPRGNFDLDATATLSRLGFEGKQNVEVNVVLLPYPNRQLKTNSLEIQATEIQIVKDVIQRK